MPPPSPDRPAQGGPIQDGPKQDGDDRHRPGLGIVIMLASIGLFACMTATIKQVTTDYSVFQILFFRNAVMLPFATLFLYHSGGLAAFRSRRPGLQAWRNGIQVIGNLLLFTALADLALADASAIQFTAPLMVTAISAVFLGAAVGWRRWSAVGLGFVGVLVMLPPGGEIKTATFILLTATVCYAVMVTLTRVLAKSDPVAVIFFYLTLTGSLAGALSLPWVWVTPPPVELFYLSLVGLLGGLAQLCLVFALRFAEPPVLAPFDYSLMIWAIGLDILIWQALPSAQTLLGAAIIASAGLYVAQREAGVLTRLRQRLRRRAKPD